MRVQSTFPNNSPTPKRLILSLLSAPELPEISVQGVIRWGELFGIDAGAVRVSLGRMTKAQLLESPRRGHYAIGPAGQALAATARSWVKSEERLKDWDGGWLVAHTAHLKRSNRGALRARERAFALDGFVAIEKELWCRPANYRESLKTTLSRMCDLGLEAETVLIEANSVEPKPQPESLWPIDALRGRYLELSQAMEVSLERLPTLDTWTAAKETFLVGESVIRQINADPLLPDAMIDASARRHMHSMMIEYDQAGRSVWARFQQDNPKHLSTEKTQ